MPVQARGNAAARVLLKEVVSEARRRRLLSADHFTVDGTLLEAWASHKSYRPRDEQGPRGGGRNRDADFSGERRSRDTHVSTTDPEARLYRKGKQQEARLCYLGHVLTENRHGLLVDVELTEADGRAEREWRRWRCCRAQRLRTGQAGRRPRLRHVRSRLRLERAGPGRDPACGPERYAAGAARSTSPDHATCGLPSESTPAQAGRRSLRLDQDDRRGRQAALSRKGPQQALVRANRRRLQPHPHWPNSRLAGKA